MGNGATSDLPYMPAVAAAAAALVGQGRRVVFPEAHDPRIVAAARRLADAGLAVPFLIGRADDVATAAAAAGVSAAGLTRLDPTVDAGGDAAVAAIRRQRPSMTPAMCARLVAKPLYLAGAMVASGQAEAMVAGADAPTRRVIEAALMTIGLAPNIATPSSFFLMQCPHAVGGPRRLVFADCAVNAAPDAGQLADIAIASADSAAAILGEPARVAFLSFSTRSSAQHARIENVTAALARARVLRPDLLLDGEFQADAALSALVAAKKAPGPSAVAGQANVLVFPDLDSGNIAYKLVQYLGGAAATGPFLQGFARPVSDLSRGASVEDIVATTVVTLARAG